MIGITADTSRWPAEIFAPCYYDVPTPACRLRSAFASDAGPDAQQRETDRVEIAVPDFSTLSRRGKGLILPPVRRETASQGPVHLVVDSTGLRVFAEGEWLESKHKIKTKRKKLLDGFAEELLVKYPEWANLQVLLVAGA